MPKNLSSSDVAWILARIGITFTRHGKEDVYTGEYQGKNRVVIVPMGKNGQLRYRAQGRQKGASPPSTICTKLSA